MNKNLRLFATMLLLAVFSGVLADEETFNFVGWTFDGAATWTSTYAAHTVNGTAATVVFASADKQSSTITDCPVTKGGDITVTLNNTAYTITGVDFVLKQWTTKTQTVTLNTSADGTTFTPTTNTSATFSLSASGLTAKAIKFTFNSTSNQVGVQSIKITYSTVADNRTATTLSFATPAGFTYIQGSGTHSESNPATLNPTVSGATINYTSDNTAVATVAADGQLSVNDVPGVANITAKFDGDASYMPSQATYQVVVKPLFDNIAALKQAMTVTEQTGAILKLTDAQFTYVNGSNYYLQDASGAVCIYSSSLTYTQGQVLNGYAEVSHKLYNSLPEITAFVLQNGTTVVDGTATPIEMNVTDASATSNLCKYISMTNATVSGGNVTDGTSTITLYDTFKQSLDFSANGSYDIVAIPIIYKTTKELAVISMTAKSFDVAIDASGYASLFFSNYALTVPANLVASTYNVVGNTLTASKSYATGSVIPANTTVILEGVANSYRFDISTQTGELDPNNQLLGTDAQTALTADDTSYFYWLSLNANKDPGSIGFYWGAANGAAFTNGAHKAYLKIAKTAGAKTAYFFNETTGITKVVKDAQLDVNAPMYNLAGQRVSKSYRGVVLQNGKKFIVR